jgi:hypothetical protein
MTFSDMPMFSTSSLPEIADAIVAVAETASDAATVVMRSARRRPLAAAGLAGGLAVFTLVTFLARRHRRSRSFADVHHDQPADQQPVTAH